MGLRLFHWQHGSNDMNLIYRNRHVISWLPALLIGAYLLLLSSVDILKVKPKYEDKAIEISLAEPLPEPTPPQPEPQPEPRPQPVPVATPEPPPVEPEAAIEQVKPKPKVVEKKVEAKKVEEPKPAPVKETKKTDVKAEPKAERKAEARAEPKQEPKPVQKPAPEVKKVEPKPEPKPESKPVSNASAEAAYVAKIRAAIEAQKRYPTGREASLERPEGNVEVWLEIDRSGRVLDSGISSKSKSMLLNRSATQSLQSIKHVAPFPDDAFAGQSSKKVLATLNYQAP